MKSDTPLDHAVFRLSPKRSRCELFVSSNGNTEQLASGLVKPFVTHLKFAEDQVAQAVQSIKLEIERDKNADTWFTKGTLERFVRFVSTPEILEMVNTFDAEMSQLEAAQTIYSQGAGDKRTDAQGGHGTGTTTAADATKKELLRAIDVRLTTVRRDLTTACARASAAGFNLDTVSELQHFANRFGAHLLNEVCTKFISVYYRRSGLISTWKPGGDDRELRSSVGSDMSIDDPAEDQSGPHTRTDRARPFDKPKLSTWQQNKSVTFASRHSNVNEKDEDAKEEIRDNVSEEKNKEEAATESSSIAATQPARRLSVQDRINLFENKQQASSGGKPIVVKSVELRRPSSDVSSGPTAAEKSVLRRWSGASDMSIDVSGEKKDTESPLCTPSSVSSVPQIKPNAVSIVSEDRGHWVLNNSENASNAEPHSGAPKFGDGALKYQANTQTYSGPSAAKEKEPSFNVPNNWKDQAASRTKFGSFTGRAEHALKNDLGSSQETSKVSDFDEEWSGGYKGHVGSESQLRGFSDLSEITFAGRKTQVAPLVPVGVVTPTVGDVASDIKFSSRREDSVSRNRLVAQSNIRGSHNHSRSFSGQFDGGAGLKFKDASSDLVESDQSTHQPQGRSITREFESEKKESSISVKQQIKVEDSEIPKMKYQKPHPGSFEQISKSNGNSDESRIAYENNKSSLPVKEVLESQDSIRLASIAPVEQVQRVRQSKGNQVLNDDLKIKANELEKLFAEHKLRVPGDQSGSARRIESANTHVEQAVNTQYRKPEAVESTPQMPARNKVLEPAGSSINVVDFDSNSLMKMVENYNYGDSLRQSFSNLSFPGDSRGKFYEKYMQKRDAKLSKEWSSKRVEKEARMKAMQDSLERSRAEMKAKFSGFADRQDSVSTAHPHAEKIRSFNFKLKREQHLIESLQNEEDDDLADFSEENFLGQGRLLGESTLGDSASRQSRKIFPGRNVSSYIPCTATASMSRSSAKISSSVSGRRRGQSESPLAQSVPNFSDLRKENTRPSGVSKTTRSQVRNHARSKSINEEIAVIKDEKPKRTQSLRKSPAASAEFKDLSSLNSDGVVLAPLKFDMEQADLGTYDQSQKGLESRSFLKKGNSIGPGAGVNAVRTKTSMASETQQDEEFDELEFEGEDLGDAAKEEEDEIAAVEDCNYTNNGKVRQSQESEKSGNSGSEIDDSTRSLTQVDCVSAAEMPSTMVSNFNKVGSLQDSPVESPVSLNSRMRYPFSYPHESSDVDASMDSPIGSPASWNSHSLTQNETDAARMRKKWGSTQKPFVVTNLSHNQSRKDVTKGFKRLLKFGRKNRGSENLVDWISATTSEGDDYTEDGRDLPNRSSEDLRKSRMGFSKGHPSDDNFNESELFSDQVQSLQSSIPVPPVHFKLRDDQISGSSLKAPRSFFSLSSFRSKGSDTKPR